jgi:hypothetical protein
VITPLAAGCPDVELLDHIEYVVLVLLRDGYATEKPGKQIVVVFHQKSLVAVEGGGVHGLHMGIGEPAEQDICLTAAAITTSVNQSLPAYGHRFTHLMS